LLQIFDVILEEIIQLNNQKLTDMSLNFYNFPFVSTIDAAPYLLVQTPKDYRCVLVESTAETETYEMISEPGRVSGYQTFPLAGFGEVSLIGVDGVERTAIVKNRLTNGASNAQVLVHEMAPFIHMLPDNKAYFIAVVPSPENWRLTSFETTDNQLEYVLERKVGTGEGGAANLFLQEELLEHGIQEEFEFTVVGNGADDKKKVIVNTSDGSVGGGNK